MNKIILKFNFLDNITLNITLIYVNDIILAKDSDVFVSYYDTDENFLIYSANNSKMSYTSNALKLPSLNEYEPCQNIEIKFKTNDEMKRWLKKLYRVLHKWDKLPNWDKIRNISNFNNRVLLNNEFWIL